MSYAPGWYVAIRSTEIAIGEVRAIALCGEEVVVFRTASGQIAAVEKYCAHQRTSLATGSVRGEHLRCAFHGWEYDGRGQCAKIQACADVKTPSIPTGAHILAFPVREELGLVWVFLGAARGERPYYELPSEAQLFSDGNWRRVDEGDIGIINSDCRDVMENGVDCAHFEPVHNLHIRGARLVETTPDQFRFEVQIRAALDEILFHGRGARWLGKLGLDAYFDGVVHGTMYGPSLLYVHIDLDSKLYVPLRFVTMLSPVGARQTKQYFAAYAPAGRLYPWQHLVTRLFGWKLKRNLVGDQRMWHDKLPSDDAVLCESDLLPIARYREWFASLGRERSVSLGARPSEAQPGPTRSEPRLRSQTEEAPANGEAPRD